MDNETLQAIRQLMQEELRPIKTDLAEIKERTLKIEVKLEHDISTKITALYDGHKLNTEKLDNIQASLDDMVPTVTALDVLHQMQKDIVK